MSKTNYPLAKMACSKSVEAQGQDVDKANLKLINILLANSSDSAQVKEHVKSTIKSTIKDTAKPATIKKEEAKPLFDDLHVFNQYEPLHINL